MTRILVIDDEPAICTIVERILMSAGYAVTVVTSARAGIEAAGKQGFDAIRALRARAPDIQVIALSGLISEGLGAPDFLGMAANLQGVARLGKPLRRQALLDLLSRQRAA